MALSVPALDISKGKFFDCLHAALAMTAQKQPLWTFDKAAAKLDGARLLA